MKILMVSNTYLPIVGGLEKSIQLFSRKFRDWGHEVQILVPELKGCESSETGVIRVPSLHQFKGTGFSLAVPLFRFLEKVVGKFRPDIIHAHHPFLMGEMALRLATFFGKPLIFTYHIMFDHYAHYLPIPAMLSKRFLVELAAGYANLATRVIAPSESVREILLHEGVETEINVVPTGVDIKAFSNEGGQRTRKDLGIPEDAIALGYAGRLAPEKNLEFLVHCVIRFMKKDPQVHFLAAGKGPLHETIERTFLEEGLRDRLHLTGVLQGQPLVDFYRALDFFVFSSKSETQGMVLCEAMAAGIPVLALDAPGIREVVKDRINGRLVMRENELEFDSAMFWLLSREPGQREMLRRMARETALHFSLDACALRALKVYEAAIRDGSLPDIGKQGDWRRMMRRLRTEWELMANFSRASGLALTEILPGVTT